MIVADQLSVHFKRRRGAYIKAVDDVSLHVREGDFFALLGENGAGKSTTMHAFLGLIRPTSGSVSILGETPERGSALFENVSYIPEEPHYPDYLTIEETVDYYAGLLLHPPPKSTRYAWLERLGLAEFRDLRLSKCSKGMKQKVGIAQALLHNPKLILLDEPMRGLDPIGVKEFRDVLVEMNRQGTTIVMNSHILAEVEAVASRIAIMQRGRVVLDDTLAAVLKASRTPTYVVHYEGSAAPPEYLSGVATHGDSFAAELPSERLHEFMSFVEQNGIVLTSCNLKKATLEDSFFAIVKEHAHA